MNLKLYNTKSNAVETFKPINPKRVEMYVCGPTVYDHIHVGNARPAIVFDVLYRLLMRHYEQVTYVRNITDIDDKIIAKAQQEKTSTQKIAQQFTQSYHDNLKQLNVLSPSFEPKATAFIPQMIDLIQRLLDKNVAYQAQDHVIFSIEKMPDYGTLSGRKLEDLRAGMRVEVADYKKSPLDFVLWKPSTGDQPGWDSPWGFGRPGWHLECSAMAQHLLSDCIDIHGGGLDLQFPHHENERAQSCCASGLPEFSNYWVHNGYITFSGEKMSKSIGNIFTVNELLDAHTGETIRYVLLSTHYRKPLDWNIDAIKQAKSALDALYQALADTQSANIAPETECMQHKCAEFEQHLLNDLNTPQALSYLHQLAHELRKAEGSMQQNLWATLIECGQRLGLFTYEPDVWFQLLQKNDVVDAAAIEQAIEQRQEAKANRDYALADSIRQQLSDQGIILEDMPDKTIWKKR